MCRAISCPKCGKMTWIGCGAHIEQALCRYSIEERCKSWQTGKCTAIEKWIQKSLKNDDKLVFKLSDRNDDGFKHSS